MVTLHDIKQSLAPELQQLNDIIAGTLRSDTPLMNTIVTRYLLTKGKQLRPMLVLLSGRLFGGVNDRVLHAGAAIEMLHNASLIHDDVSVAGWKPSAACGPIMWLYWWATSL